MKAILAAGVLALTVAGTSTAARADDDVGYFALGVFLGAALSDDGHVRGHRHGAYPRAYRHHPRRLLPPARYYRWHDYRPGYRLRYAPPRRYHESRGHGHRAHHWHGNRREHRHAHRGY